MNAFETQLHAYVLESVPAAIALLRGPGLPPVPADPLRLERVGLYVARALAEAHGGALTAASPGAGRGATFTLVLPLA